MIAESHGVTLAWDESSGGNIEGYKVYFGLSTRAYSMSIDVSKATETTVFGFFEDKEHYAAVTAYYGFSESEFSNEVSYTIDDGVIAADDNCPNTPNGSSLGSCSKLIGDVPMGLLGSTSYFVTCTSDDDCEFYGGICQMDQEDFNNNGIGDVCECYADFNNSGKVNLTDLAKLKGEFGRTDCSSTLVCIADANTDNKVNLSDLIILKREFGNTGCPIT
jgi:hypothetical protein